MNDEYTYEEEASLSADRDMFDEYRFTSGDEARTEETHYMAAFLVGEERGEPVKKTFETLMAEFREAGGSWRVLCELFAALLSCIDMAIMDGDVTACAEYNTCIRNVIAFLNEEFGEDKASWSRFINSMRNVKDVNFVKNAKKAENCKEKGE